MRTDPDRMAATGRYVVWDTETLRLSHEVRGGWRNIKDFGLAVAVTIDDRGAREVWQEQDASALIQYLAQYPRIVGFNSRRFDLEVLSAYGPVDHLHQPTLDLLESIRTVTGRRRGLSLQNIAHTMFGASKQLSDGTEAVRLWRSGRPEDRQRVIGYCAEDVALTRRILEFGMEYGYVLVPVPDVRHGGAPVAAQVAVNWGEDGHLAGEPRLVEPEILDF
jgi:uncharacterized protein YprB with RNaseH-like and TPR domain